MDAKGPYVVAVLIRIMHVGMFVLSKAAFDKGMNYMVFVFYRQAFATVFLIPFAIAFGRKSAPPLSFATFCKIFMVSLFGITASFDIYGLGTVYTSASLAAAVANTQPVITIFFAVLLGMEKIKLRTSSGVAKIVGVLFCIAGAAILAFYDGPHMKPMIHHHPFRHQSNGSPVPATSSEIRLKGCFLLLISNITWSLWLVLQVKMLESYPSKLLLTTLQCLLSAIQSFIIAIAFKRTTSDWKLHFDIGLLAVAYCGIVVTGVTFYLQTWCMEKRGPVFFAMSNPLTLIITIVSSAFLLGELITFESVLGGTLLIGSLYCVLWGQSKEQKVALLMTNG